MRVLFVTAPLSGHFFPMVPLAWACRVRGHEVLVASARNFLPTVLGAGLPAASCGPPADFACLSPPVEAHDDVESRRHEHGRIFGGIAADNLEGTMSLVDSWRPGLVVVERAEFSGLVAAAVRGIPCVELQWGVPALREFRTAATARLRAHLASLGLTDLPEPVQVLNQWPPSLRLAHARAHRSMRYVPYNGAAAWPERLAARRLRPRVCVTLGTVLPRIATEELAGLVEPLLESLARSDFEIVVAVEDEVADTWRPLPDGVLHAGRIPLAEVLRTCDCVIHHGGNGTALTALEAGVPQLVLPHFDDQIENGDAVVRSGAGLGLSPEQATPHEVVRACHHLLSTRGFSVAATRMASEIAAQPTPAETVAVLEELVTGSGGVTQAAA